MRKRRKKKIITNIDDEGYYLNCYGNRILWTRKELSKAKRKAQRLNQKIKWG